jgi:hypothetical protein
MRRAWTAPSPRRACLRTGSTTRRMRTRTACWASCAATGRAAWITLRHTWSWRAASRRAKTARSQAVRHRHAGQPRPERMRFAATAALCIARYIRKSSMRCSSVPPACVQQAAAHVHFLQLRPMRVAPRRRACPRLRATRSAITAYPAAAPCSPPLQATAQNSAAASHRQPKLSACQKLTKASHAQARTFEGAELVAQLARVLARVLQLALYRQKKETAHRQLEHFAGGGANAASSTGRALAERSSPCALRSSRSALAAARSAAVARSTAAAATAAAATARSARGHQRMQTAHAHAAALQRAHRAASRCRRPSAAAVSTPQPAAPAPPRRAPASRWRPPAATGAAPRTPPGAPRARPACTADAGFQTLRTRQRQRAHRTGSVQPR